MESALKNWDPGLSHFAATNEFCNIDCALTVPLSIIQPCYLISTLVVCLVDENSD